MQLVRLTAYTLGEFTGERVNKGRWDLQYPPYLIISSMVIVILVTTVTSDL